ncbi:SecDF P1 head subdomain-containing protein [Aquimarina rubra]|uniref:SecDF P1 head subdomain domain-containing protein n=1 Tax=Aquimarina rubra TaxID=1920033 RepID=A0ABW5LLD6_9FLAO
MFKKSLSIFKISVRIIMLLLLVSACSFGPKSDKVIEMTLEPNEAVDSDQEMNRIVQKLRQRLQKVTTNAEVLALPDKNQIKITVATHYKTERFNRYIVNPGKLDFYETYKNEEMFSFLAEVYERVKNKDSIVHPFQDLIKESGYPGGPILFSVEERDTATVNRYFSMKGVESALPVKKRYVRFLWGIKEKGTGYIPLYALKKNKLGKPALSGDVVMNAFPTYNALDMPAISMQMNEEGAEKWESLTGKAYQQRSNIAIVLNDQVYSAPGVSAGPIHGGRSEISGDFTAEEAQDFANILMSGAIPKMSIIEVKVREIK